MRKGKILLLLLGLLLALPTTALAYPEGPITYLIPFDAGGQSDLEARRQQNPLESILGQSIIVQYKPGGGGAIGWSELASSPPTGYLICGINIPHIILQPLVLDNAGYKTEEILPVALFQGTPIGLAVSKDSPWETLDDFIADAKKKPGRITVGGSGTYSGHHLACLQLEKLAGIKLAYVPYTGAAPQMTAFLGGHIDAILGNSNDLVLHGDKLRVLAIGGAEPFPLLPDVPTFIELGLDMFPSIDRGVAVPAGTPPERVAVLEYAFLQIMEDENIRAQMWEQGFVPLVMGQRASEEYIAQIRVEYEKILQELDLI
ncbi:MAG: tripartite tricarboxylate transporter substrate binding protein [Limnochordia bacterium]